MGCLWIEGQLYYEHQSSKVPCSVSPQGLQSELQSLREQLSQLSDTAQEPLSEVSKESKDLILQTMSDLTDRLDTLQDQAKLREGQLKERAQHYNKYQVSALGVANYLALGDSIRT